MLQLAAMMDMTLAMVFRRIFGQGIIAAAVQVVLSFLCTTYIVFLTATHDINNIVNGKVVEKSGMIYQYSYLKQW